MTQCPGPITGTQTPPTIAVPARHVVIFLIGGLGGGGGRIAAHAPENHANSHTVMFFLIVTGAPLVLFGFGAEIVWMMPHSFGQELIGHCIAVRLVLGLCTCACDSHPNDIIWAQKFFVF
jgi:hypothetical protein